MLQIAHVKGVAPTVSRLQDEKEERMTLPAAFQENIDWVNQPPPTNARDTHALHFWLSSPEGSYFQGLVFYRPGTSPSSPITQHQNGIQGKGYLIPNAPVCQRVLGSPWTPQPPGPWVRVQVTFRTTADGTSHIFANLLLQDSSGPDALPGETTSGVEFDRVEATFGDVIMFPGQGSGWFLNLTKTTVSL
jgi:hypothetical protein